MRSNSKWLHRGPAQRRLALEPLEPRYAPAGLPLNVPLPIEGQEHLSAAALLPSGHYRIGGQQLGAWATLWEFDADGHLLREDRLGLAGDGTHASVHAISPSGRWLAGEQYDLDFDDIDKRHFLLWDGDDPDQFALIDVSAIVSWPSARITDVSNDGVVILQAEGRAYRWDAASGFQRLVSLHEIGGDTSEYAQEVDPRAISADGSVIVGISGYHLERRPTVWTADGPQELPSPSGAGAALAVSADGRVIGGRITDAGQWRPAVWLDGELVVLKTEQGQPATGEVTAIASGIGDDPAQWVAFGHSEQRAWIAFSDGVVQPLEPWLWRNYGLAFHGDQSLRDSGGIGSGVFDAFLVDDTLQIAAHGWRATGMTHSIPPSIFYTPTSARWISAPLDSAGQPDGELPYDVNGDGTTSPLDALLVINALNAQNDSGQTPSPLGGLDVNGDGLLSPIDALKVINFLNGPPQWPGLISIGNLTVQQQSTPAPLHVELQLDDGVTLMAGAQLPDGKLRLGGFFGGITPLQIELTGRGELLGTRELPVQAGQLQSVVTAVSPNGRWLGGSQNQANYHAALPDTWPIYGLWDAENPGAFLPLDLASLTGLGMCSITDISDTGAVLINSGDGRAYRWEAASGFQQLISLQEVATTSTPAAQYAHAAAISTDGRVIVGSSGRLGEAPLATRWIDGVPEALPGLGGSSDTYAVSLDGRVIGGRVDDGIVERFSLGDDGPHIVQGPTSQAAVWVDGQLRLLKDVQGQHVPGEVRHVVSGIGGDPGQWIALGTMGGQTFIAFAGGVVRNLNDWLRDRYGIAVERQQRIVAAFIDGNSLTIVSYDHEHLPLAPHEVGDSDPGGIYRPPAKRLFVLPLDAPPSPAAHPARA